MWNASVTLVLLAIIAGCSSTSAPTSAPNYSGWTDEKLLSDIQYRFIGPMNSEIYFEEQKERENSGIYWEQMGFNWQNVAYLQTECAMKRIANTATRLDLEIIHNVWVNKPIYQRDHYDRLYGRFAYEQAVGVFSDSAADCMFITRRWIEKQSNL